MAGVPSVALTIPCSLCPPFCSQATFDGKYGGTWHCVVGRNFGCSVTHETKYLVFFKVGNVTVRFIGAAHTPKASVSCRVPPTPQPLLLFVFR